MWLLLLKNPTKERGGGFLVEEDILAGLLAYFLGYKGRDEILAEWGIK